MRKRDALHVVQQKETGGIYLDHIAVSTDLIRGVLAWRYLAVDDALYVCAKSWIEERGHVGRCIGRLVDCQVDHAVSDCLVCRHICCL